MSGQAPMKTQQHFNFSSANNFAKNLSGLSHPTNFFLIIPSVHYSFLNWREK